MLSVLSNDKTTSICSRTTTRFVTTLNESEPNETKRRRTAIIISLPSKLFEETSNVSKKG